MCLPFLLTFCLLLKGQCLLCVERQTAVPSYCEEKQQEAWMNLCGLCIWFLQYKPIEMAYERHNCSSAFRPICCSLCSFPRNQQHRFLQWLCQFILLPVMCLVVLNYVCIIWHMFSNFYLFYSLLCKIKFYICIVVKAVIILHVDIALYSLWDLQLVPL